MFPNVNMIRHLQRYSTGFQDSDIIKNELRMVTMGCRKKQDGPKWHCLGLS